MDELEEMQWSFVKLRGKVYGRVVRLLCYMELKPGPPPNDRNQGLR